jgi:hypothetical protein
MAEAAARAVALSQTRGGSVLDYSEQSLATVEEMLAELSGVSLIESQLTPLAQDFGSYVLEVARRCRGGEYQWLTDRQEPVLVWGMPTYRVALIGWGKVRGRLLGDPADNIPFFYAGFAERVENPIAGKQVTFA